MAIQKFRFDMNRASLFDLTHEEFLLLFLLLDLKKWFVDMVKKLFVHEMFVFTRSAMIFVTIHADVFWFAQCLLLLAWITIRLYHNSFSFWSFSNEFFKSFDLIWELSKSSTLETFDRWVDLFHSSSNFSTWVHVFKTCETYLMKTWQCY